MSEPELYYLRWRGQTSGPHAWPAIIKMLDDHEVGLWHEVQHQGRWLTLGDLLQERSGATATSAPRRKPTKVQPPPEAETVCAAPAPESAPAPVAAAAAPRSGPDPACGTPRFRPRRLKVFVLLGMCAGFTGAHNFYAGYWATALAQLVFSGLTFALGFGFVITWLWAFIELLLVHTDGRGVRMT